MSRFIGHADNRNVRTEEENEEVAAGKREEGTPFMHELAISQATPSVKKILLPLALPEAVP